MNIKNLDEALEEAERFVTRVKTLKAAFTSPVKDEICGYGTEQAAVRRASMDLTKALSKLRNQ